MTLIEEMAKAHWADSENTAWEKLGREDRECMIDVMRGALMVLVQGELPDAALKCSLGISKSTKQEMFESRIDLRPVIFRAMLTAIAEQK
jgi:hypothetical protein